jgi:hypothetical protein
VESRSGTLGRGVWDGCRCSSEEDETEQLEGEEGGETRSDVSAVRMLKSNPSTAVRPKNHLALLKLRFASALQRRRISGIAPLALDLIPPTQRDAGDQPKEGRCTRHVHTR